MEKVLVEQNMKDEEEEKLYKFHKRPKESLEHKIIGMCTYRTSYLDHAYNES
jgi:hypothetical protein